jgi:hypothetical protein
VKLSSFLDYPFTFPEFLCSRESTSAKSEYLWTTEIQQERKFKITKFKNEEGLAPQRKDCSLLHQAIKF